MLWLSLRVAGVSTAVSLVLGWGLAWLLVNRQFPGKREVGVAASLALALPSPVICYYFLSGRAPLWSWGFTAAAVVSATPMLVRAGRVALTALDPVYGRAARSVGASDWRVFWRIELPLVFRSALAAAGLAFARVLAEFAFVFLLTVRLLPHD